LTHPSNYSPSANYTKALATLEESLRTGQFARYSQKKKQEIWEQLCRYARQSGIKIQASILAACLAAGLSLSTPTEAQTVSFTAQTGSSNPLNGVSISYSKPAFVDIDGDGDKDVFIGSRGGAISYYKNTGTSTAPVFTLQSGASNPLNISVPYSSPAFVDIDGDGDMDVFIGQNNGSVVYYKNTGTSTAPVFTLQTGASNPLNSVSTLSGYATPAFVDIDGDGDFDAFIGGQTGVIYYYKNTGTSTAPVFTQQTGAANPLNAVSVSGYAAPCFIDVDKNGTMDAFIGASNGAISYYKNTGTSSTPAFTQQTGTSNPFNGVDVGNNAGPAAVDINGDTKVDIFIGSNTGLTTGPISYYQNTSTVLPLQLLDFTGSHHPDYNQLQWQTADEVNTQEFGLERSSNGASFTTIATIKAAGGGNNSYSYQDKTAINNKMFYRLKMIDIDGRFTYSNIIWINSEQTGVVSLYPNPAREVVNISMGNFAMINTTADLYRSDGILLQKILITADQQQINIHRLAKGVYVLKFADGTISTFIKE
jgi:hypothetical protein